MARRKSSNHCLALFLFLVSFQAATASDRRLLQDDGTISVEPSPTEAFQDPNSVEPVQDPESASAASPSLEPVSVPVIASSPSLEPVPAPVLASSPSLEPVLAPGPSGALVPEVQSSCGVGGPCLNGGEPTLIELNGNVSCVCNCTSALDFDGTHCEIARRVCSVDGFFCANGGDCTAASIGSAVSCVCPPGYYGPNCLEKGNVCSAALICKNGGTCTTSLFGAAQCDCPTGFGGADCASETTSTPEVSGPASIFKSEGHKVNWTGVAFGIIAGCLVVGLLGAGFVFWRRKKRRSPYSFDYLYNQQSAPMTRGAFSEVQMEDIPANGEYRNGSNIHNTSLGY